MCIRDSHGRDREREVGVLVAAAERHAALADRPEHVGEAAAAQRVGVLAHAQPHGVRAREEHVEQLEVGVARFRSCLLYTSKNGKNGENGASVTLVEEL